jgi:hypothetical protein
MVNRDDFSFISWPYRHTCLLIPRCKPVFLNVDPSHRPFCSTLDRPAALNRLSVEHAHTSV